MSPCCCFIYSRCRHTNRKLDQVVLSTCSLNFNSSNWNQPQPVTFKAVEDFKVDGAQKIQIELDVIQPITKSKRAAQIPVPVTLTDPMDVASFEGLEVSICSNGTSIDRDLLSGSNFNS